MDSNSNCLACDPRCSGCIAEGPQKCISCIRGFYKNSISKCVECDSLCITCSDGGTTNCHECQSPYADPYNCRNCKKGYYFE